MNLEKQLAHLAQECVRLNVDRWLLTLRNGFDFKVSTVRDDSFLSLDAETEVQAKPERLVAFIERSAELPGNVKVALPTGSPKLHLRVEFPLPEDGKETRSVAPYLNAIQVAHAKVHNWASSGDGERARPYSEGGSPDLTSLEEILNEAGWESRKRASGALLVDLETPGQFFQAEVKRLGKGVRFRAAACSGLEPGTEEQRSIGLYLLEVNAELRYSRGFLERNGVGIAAGFEIRLDWMPDSAETGHALAALSVACRCARELEVLSKDTRLASLFWTARGLSFRTKEQTHG
jgi:hypothetical protein